MWRRLNSLQGRLTLLLAVAAVAGALVYVGLTQWPLPQLFDWLHKDLSVSLRTPVQLGMYGGLTEDNSWVDPFISMPTGSLLALVEKGVRFSHLPGAVYEYSNLGFALASLAVSRAAGRPLGDFIGHEVLQPLGLNSTYCDNAVPDGVTRAVGYSLDTEGAGCRIRRRPPTPSSARAAW